MKLFSVLLLALVAAQDASKEYIKSITTWLEGAIKIIQQIFIDTKTKINNILSSLFTLLIPKDDTNDDLNIPSLLSSSEVKGPLHPSYEHLQASVKSADIE